MSDKLVIYYSHDGENYVNGEVRNLSVGNCELIADYIFKETGADRFRVETKNPYPEDYYDLMEVAQNEMRRKSRPELKRSLDSLDGYKDIYIVGPCWWGTYPMAMFTQLEKLDFKGKRIHALMSHEGSGLGQSQKDLKKIIKGAVFTEPLAVKGSHTKSSEEEIRLWAQQELNPAFPE